MSVQFLPAPEALARLAIPLGQPGGFSTVIDARSEDEFAHDHLPGAVNWPSLDNAQRIVIGTMYKQVSPFEAQKRGAAMVAANIARHIERVRSLAEEMFSPATEESQTLDFMVDVMAGVRAFEPGFLPLWIGGYLSNGNVAAWEAMREEAIHASYVAAVERLGMPATPTLMARMRVIGETVEHTMRIAFSKPQPERGQLLTEIKRMVRLVVSRLD